MKKVLFVILLMSLLFLTGCKKSVYMKSYESDLDEFSVDYDDDNDVYDIFLDEEQRHIYIPRSLTQIIISDDNEIVIEEYYNKLNQPITAKMYFYITIDWGNEDEEE